MNSPASSQHKRPVRVLLIEDDEATRVLYRAYLEGANYEVADVTDGESGALKLTEFRPDIVITDIFLPEKDGLEVILEARKTNTEIKVIAISGGTGRVEGDDYLEIAQLFGASKTLLKPFSKQDLLDACAEAVSVSD